MNRGLCGLLGAVALAGTSFLAAEPAAGAVLITNAGNGGLRNDHPGTVGLAFRVGARPIQVTSLGFWDEGADGLLLSHDVGLWRDSGQVLLASATVQAGLGSPAAGEFRYQPVAPVTLYPNTVYSIGAVYPGGNTGDRFRNPSAAQTFDLTGLDPRYGINARWSPGPPLAFPLNSGGVGAYVGANLQFTLAPPPPGMAASLVGYWNFDSAATPFADQSGNGFGGTPAGGAARTTATTALGAGAMRLDPATGSYLQLPDMTGGGRFAAETATLTMWVKLNNHTPTDGARTGLEGFGTAAADSHYTWTDGLAYFSTFRNGSRVDSVNMSAAPDRTQWTHLAIVTEPGTGTYHVYQNGQPVRDADPGAFIMSTAPTVGRSFAGFYVDGYVDEVAVYNKALSLAEVRAQYVGGVTAAPTMRVLDLADIAGGGNGLGTGSRQGVNPTTGAVATTQFFGDYTGDGAYHVVAALPLVDGVFIPNGTAQINSAGATAALPGTNNLSWDNVWNGPNTGVTNNTAGGVNYDSVFHTILGMHINKGITFDLDAIRDAHRGYRIERFLSAIGDTTGAGSDFRVFLDGAQVVQRTTQAGFIDIPIATGNRFLTLVSMNGGWAFFGDPQLVMAVPEPGSCVLMALGTIGLVGCVLARTRRRPT